MNQYHTLMDVLTTCISVISTEFNLFMSAWSCIKDIILVLINYIAVKYMQL